MNPYSSNKVVPLSRTPLVELQKQSKIRNDIVADKLCDKIKICFGLSTVCCLFIYSLILIITIPVVFSNDHNSQLDIIDDYLSENGSNSVGN